MKAFYDYLKLTLLYIVIMAALFMQMFFNEITLYREGARSYLFKQDHLAWFDLYVIFSLPWYIVSMVVRHLYYKDPIRKLYFKLTVILLGSYAFLLLLFMWLYCAIGDCNSSGSYIIALWSPLGYIPLGLIFNLVLVKQLNNRWKEMEECRR